MPIGGGGMAQAGAVGVGLCGGMWDRCRGGNGREVIL